MTVDAGDALGYASNFEVLKLITGLLLAWGLWGVGIVLVVEPFVLPAISARFLGIVLALVGLFVGYQAGVALLYKATADAMVHAAGKLEV